MVAERAHDLQVMADEQIGQPVIRLQIAQKLHDLHLHRHVEREVGSSSTTSLGRRIIARAMAMRWR
jgi:uncharacterized protein YerC